MRRTRLAIAQHETCGFVMLSAPSVVLSELKVY
jgi:hypothetical protein